MPRRRPSRRRLLVAALAILVAGYHLGQLYQQQRLAQEGIALVGEPATITGEVQLPLRGHWTLLLAGEPDPACDAMLHSLLRTVNRLASWPRLQSRFRFILLATRAPDPSSLWGYIPWASVIYMGDKQRSELADALQVDAETHAVCGPQSQFALTGPDGRLYAHVRLDKPRQMAESLRQLTEALEPMIDTPTTEPGWLDRLNTWLLRILSQHWLSARMHGLARSETPWLKNALIRYVRSHYDVNMQEAAVEDPFAYPSFNAFFTRALKPGARPIDPEAAASPADGVLSQAGHIVHDRLVQAKGHEYSLYALLGGDGFTASQFESGSFATIYLSPRDYHRVHMPLAGTLREMVFIPGDLFGVSEATTQLVPGLFARNERLILLFDTDRGPMAVVLVGAIFVGSMQTVWHGEVRSDRVQRWEYKGEDAPQFEKGEEIARFNMGSTVIVLHTQYAVDMREELVGQHVRMGQAIGD